MEAKPARALTERAIVEVRVAQGDLQHVPGLTTTTSLQVSTTLTADGWTLQIRDDRRGVDTGTTAAQGRRTSGMTVMPEPAEQIGARIDRRSRPDGGTVVRVAIPTGAHMGAKENG